MASEPNPQAAPTAEDLQKMTAVANAGEKAAQEAENPERAQADVAQAMKAERDRQQIVWLPDEQIDKIAEQLSNKMIEGLDSRGAFEPLPEPVQPQPLAPPAPGQEQEGAAPGPPGEPVEAPAPASDGDTMPQAPRKTTWAERFMGRV